MVTEAQMKNFTGVATARPVQDIMANINPAIVLPVNVQQQMEAKVWDSTRVGRTRESLYKTIGVGNINPPTQIEQDNALNFWWKKEGQFLPRYVLDELGIVGGETVPTIKESMELQNTQQLTAVKDHLVIPRDNSKDPLGGMVVIPPESQETDDEGKVIKSASIDEDRATAIKETSIEDLEFIENVMASNLLDPDFDETTLKAVQDEIGIKKFVQIMEDNVDDFPLIVLLGTDLLDTFSGKLPSSLNRDNAIVIKAASRVRERLAQQDPSLIKSIGLESGNLLATVLQFMVLPNVAKLKVFAKLPSIVKAAIGVGSKTGLMELLKVPEKEDTFKSRAKDIAIATGLGALTGAILETFFIGAKAVFSKIKDLPISQQADKIMFNSPDLKMTKPEIMTLLKHLKSTNPEQFQKAIAFKPTKIVKSKVVSKGKFLRAGFAEIEKPGKVLVKAAKAISKNKEAVAIQTAKAILATKVQPSKAVKPVKVITKADAASLKEVGALGEGEKLRIVASPQLRRSIQAAENEIAKLKTKRDQLKAEKQFVKAKTIAQEVAKKENALINLKERSEIKLENTTEGFKTKIEKIKVATEFKNELRNDAISMVTGIESGLRKDFIIRANKVKTIRGLQKLTEDVQRGIERFERKAAISDLNKTVGQIEEKIDELPSPQREKLIGIIDSISTKKVSKQKLDPLDIPRDPDDLDVKARRGRKQLLGADLVSLQRTTQKLASKLAGQLESLEPQVEEALRLPNERVRQLNLLTQKNANEISVEDINFIVESLQETFHEAKLKGKLLVRRGEKPVEGIIGNTGTAKTEVRPTAKTEKIQKKIEKGKDVITRKTGIQKLATDMNKLTHLDELHSDTLIELMTTADAPSTTLILDTLPHKGLRETAETFNAWRKVSIDEFNKIGFNDLDQLLSEHTVTLAGIKVKLTLSELMSLEMDTRSPDNLLQRLNTEGIQIGDEKAFIYIKDAHGEDVVDRLKEINDAVAIVRKDKVAMALLDFTERMNIVQRGSVNDMAKLRFGHEIARDENYYPRSRVGEERVSGAKGKISIPPEKQGRYQVRTGGVLPIRLRPWHEVFLGGLEADAAFSGMTLPLRNARLLLSDKGFIDALKAAGRQQELSNIIEIFSNVQGVTTSKDIVDIYGSKILKARTTSALGFRISTRGTQVMSFYAAQAITGTQGAITISPVVDKEIMALIEANSAPMSLRWISRRVGVEVGTNATDDAFSLLFFDQTKKLTNKGMLGLVKGDRLAIQNIYKKLVVPELLSKTRSGKNINPFAWEGDGQTVLDIKKFTKDDIGSDEFTYASMRRLEYVVRRSQPMFDMLDRSVSMSSPNFVRRSFLMFRTALNAMENVVDSSVIQAQKGQITKPRLIQKLGAVLTSLTAVALWKRGLKWAINTVETAILAALGIFKFKEPKEKKETLKDIGVDTLKGIASLNPVTRILAALAEKTADKIGGNDYPWGREPVENPVLETINSGGGAVIDVSQFVADIGLLDNFVEENTQADIDHNEKLVDRIVDDFTQAVKSGWDFGTTITGVPLQAPVQEFIKPLFDQSKIAIIREVTFGDVDNPQKFSESVFHLYKQRTDLKEKERTERLTQLEESKLATLNKFASDMNAQAAILKETQQHEMRKLRFLALESHINAVNSSLELIDQLNK